MTDDEDKREEDAPVEIFDRYFQARGWTAERVQDNEVMCAATGSWTQYELRAVYRPDDRVLQFLAFPDIKVPPEKRAAVHEALGLINEQLWLGHFEMWSQSGMVVYRNAALVEEEGQMSLEAAETLSESALEECERFYPVFQFVLWGGKTPSEAISAAMIDTLGEA